jgi:hypothetical protein
MIPVYAIVYCPTCDDFRAWRDLYVLASGEIMCQHCDQWTGDFEDELD